MRSTKSTAGPEVDRHTDAPQTVAQHPDHEGLQFAGPQDPSKEAQAVGHDYWRRQDPHHDRKERRRICGLAPLAFWLIVATVVAVIIAGVVGGVVGSQKSSTAEKSSSAADSTDGSSSTTSTPNPQSSTLSTTPQSSIPSTTSSTPSITTTEIVGPSSTLYRDCPSIQDVVHSYAQDGSSVPAQLFRQDCDRAAYNIHGIAAVVNKPTSDLSDCIDLCGAYNLKNQAAIEAGEQEICNSVCWRNTFDTINAPGSCFGFVTVNVSGYWNVSFNGACDSGYLMNQNVILGG